MTKNDFIYGIVKNKVIKFGDLHIDGGTAPYFVDIRSIYSHPELFKFAVDELNKYLQDKSFDHICGVETASLPLVGGLGLKYNIPTIYLRTKRKNNGRPENLVEGHYQKNDEVYIIDDLTITTELSIDFIKDVESTGLKVKGLLAVFEKKIPKKCAIPFKEMGYEHFCVFNYKELAEVIAQEPKFGDPQKNVAAINKFANE